MPQPRDRDARYERCHADLRRRNQQHVLAFWPELDPRQRAHLVHQIESIPWATIDPLIESHVRQAPRVELPGRLEPAPVWPAVPRNADTDTYRDARALGRDLIRAGKVAAFTVAGGQGTRLGYDGPKGVVPVTPVGERSLFSIFADTIRAVRDRHRVAIPWYIMTSPGNHDATVAYLERHAYFGLPAADVRLFSQAMLPAFDLAGRLILEAKDRIALAPDGHGGSLKALVASGALADMRDRGVDVISYFQVDNPLVKPFDPLFIGLHAATGSDMSTKVTPKAHDLEKVGNVCLADGKVTVIEYSDFPDDLARARDEHGHRRYNAGNLAIHLFDVGFVQRIMEQAFALPFRRAGKIVPYIDASGTPQTPTAPNAVKLETFVFDALPLANNPLVLGVDRSEEFSPVKNATGVDSAESAKHDQIRRACRWLESAGIAVPRRPDGEPDVTIAIAPSFAIDAEDVRARRSEVPRLEPGAAVYLT